MSEYLDTRDLLAEWEALTDRAQDPDQSDPLDDDETARLDALQGLVDEIGEQEMRWGETMVPDEQFVDYARELAEDIGAVPKDLPWPACHIDWKAAADSLRMDYTSVTFDGTDYLVRL